MDRGRSKKKGISVPTSLLNQIDGDGFDNSEWQRSHNMGGKRKSRKESRKELRQSKRQKRLPTGSRERQLRETESVQKKGASAAPTVNQKMRKPEPPAAAAKKHKPKEPKKPFMSAHDLEMRRKEEEDAEYYAKKLGIKGLRLKDDGDGMGDLLGDLDFDEFPDSQEEGGSESDAASSDSDVSNGDGNVYDDDDDDDENEMTAEETMAKLALLKAKKNAGSNASKSNLSKPPSNQGLRIVREDELGLSDDSFSDEDEDDDEDENSSDPENVTAEETMAKLASLKAKKSDSYSARDTRSYESPDLQEDDSLSESDFDESDESDDEEMTAEETMAKLAALKAKKTSAKQANVSVDEDDDSINDDDFDSDEESEGEELTADETMRRLAALKKKKAAVSEQNLGSDLESESESDSEDENPYMPPSRRNRTDTADESTAVPDGVVLDAEESIKMRRVFKGALNRLTESTFNHVVNEIELAFSKYSRAEASDVLTEQIMENISGSQNLQHTFFVVYGGLIAVLYRSMGTSFAASLIQSLVEGILKQGGATNNYLALLVECYSLHVVSSRLMYDLIKSRLELITDTESETYVEQVLVIVRNGGSMLRTDDPLALKEVIIVLQQRISSLGGSEALPPRMRFLVDTIVALKNNRQRASSELVVALRHRIRKTLQNNSATAAKEPLQVGLEDIVNSKTKGKWWLVGASWKGNQVGRQGRDEQSAFALVDDKEDGVDGSAPDWLELAKKQRLNTDIRRAVFVALMGAEDYLDACLRIDKLGLKNKQERDVPHVILHCLGQEPVYNPYYALVAAKQCTRHSTRKTFQFRLFDWLDSHPQGNTQLAMHYGRFYASLVLQKVLGLEILKAVDFLGATGDVQVFLEVFFVTLYRELGRQAEKDARRHLQQGLSRVDGQVERDGRELTLLLSKCKEEKVLRGMQLITQAVSRSEAIRNERDRDRIVWGTALASDMADELVKRGGLNDEL